MPSYVRPSLILNVDIDERDFDDEIVADIKRSYSYVAPSQIKPADAPVDTDDVVWPVANKMTLTVRMHRPYWEKNDPEAQELWEAVMPKWLHNMFAKVSNTITASNKIRREKGRPTLDFPWTGINFIDKMDVTVKAPEDSSIPDSTIDLIEDLREIAAAGAFGEGAVAVCIPSKESYDAQYAAAYAEAKAKAEAEAAAAREAAEAEMAAAAMAEAEGFEEIGATGDGTEELVAAEEVAESADDAAVAEEKLVVVPEFDVDYTLWSATFADGTVKTYDSAKAEFVD